MILSCENLNWKLLLAFYIIDKFFELWIGKTDKVKAGSLLELIWNSIKAILKITKE